MASLIKTYSGDLTTSIAGVIWDRIKQADEKRELEKSKASEEVKQEAVKLKKEDPNSIPVQDKDLRDTVVKIFGPLEGKLLQTESKVENLSAKITMVAGSISDTQKLLINRNQLLEEKFDTMLKVVGNRSAIEKQKEAEAKFDDLEKQLEKGMDLSGTFAYEKTSTGSYGILGKLLSGILGNRFTAKLVAQISRALIPKGVRSRARLIRRSLLPVRKFARGLRRPGSFIARRVVTPFMMNSAKIFGRVGTKFGRAALGRLLQDSIITRRLALRPVGKRLLTGGWGTAGLADRIINWKATQATLEMNKKNLAKRGIKIASQTGGEGLGRRLQKGIFMRAIKSPTVQKAIVKKLGKEGAEKIGVKLAAGGTKGGFPIVGTGYAVIEGLVRLAMGDPKGMMLSFGSGIPAAGWGFAIIDILRDIDIEAYTKNIEPNLPVPSDENIANFFMDAFGISPDQYEMGNVNVKPGGLGINIDSISEILGVTQAFGDAAGFGPDVKGLIGQAGLSSYPLKSGYTFDIGSSIGGSGTGDASQNKEAEVREKEKYKEEEEGPIIDDERTSGEKVGDIIGETVDEVDRSLDFIRDNVTGGERDDGVFTLPFGIEIRNPFNTKPGEGGVGGDPVKSTTPKMGGSGSIIEFWGQQGRDLSGEPGVDFSFKDYRNNYNLFPGYVLETGLLYGSRYGNVVVVRSTDPSNGKQFDSLYSHFPDGGIYVKPGQQVGAGSLLGAVGFVSVDTPGVPQMQPNNAGNMSGWHTSVDFFEPGSAARYHNADKIISLVMGANGRTPEGLLESLKPPTTTNDDQSSLNNIEANSKLASTMTGMVENGSSERMMTKRKIAKRLPIVIINNQIVNTSQTQIAMGNTKESGDFFEAYNLARHTV